VELSSDFKDLLSSIQPGDQDVTDAKAAHEKVREQLRNDSEFKDAHKDTFLSGSYARHTAINDINDVDVICVVDINPDITEPEVVLAWTQGILDKYYKETKRQGRSVGTQAAKGVWLDIVPATPIAADDGPLWIPDREANQWVKTHPKGQIQVTTDKNKATSGYYVHVVKLMKFWRDRLPRESCRLKSYILESMIHGSIGSPTSHATGVVNALEGMERRYGTYRDPEIVPAISDPGYASVSVAKHWEFADFKDFMEQVKSAASTARKALNSTDESDSRKLWRQVFGSNFGK
jgi:hypothetical protein